MLAAGQLHHALFDAEEALSLQPGSAQAAELASMLRQAVEQQAATGPGDQGSDNGEEVADPF